MLNAEFDGEGKGEGVGCLLSVPLARPVVVKVRKGRREGREDELGTIALEETDTVPQKYQLAETVLETEDEVRGERVCPEGVAVVQGEGSMESVGEVEAICESRVDGVSVFVVVAQAVVVCGNELL